VNTKLTIDHGLKQMAKKTGAGAKSPARTPERKKPGPPKRFSYRPTLTVRLTMPLYEEIKAAAARLGKSISEEIEGRLQAAADIERDRKQAFALLDDARKMVREAREVRSAEQLQARVEAYRRVCVRLLGDAEAVAGKPTRVIISSQYLDAEAGIGPDGFISEREINHLAGNTDDDEAA
jgi:hypothetical protein